MDTLELPRLIAALNYAAHQHRDQRRKDEDETPYINHPIALLHILNVEAGVTDADVLIGAVLHDVLEDCSGPHQMYIEERRAEIRDRFGEPVLVLVEAVTDDKTLARDERKHRQVEHAASIPLGAKLIKLADKTANLRDIVTTPPAGWSPEKIEAYADWAARVVEGLRGNHTALEELFDDALAARGPVSRE
jgi:guanosine-3',5'-bis(diphosphate) 3'-pyrophosphohydrolase